MNNPYYKFLSFIGRKNKMMFVWYLINIIMMTTTSILLVNLFNALSHFINNEMINGAILYFICIIVAGLIASFSLYKIRIHEHQVILEAKVLIIDYIKHIDLESLTSPSLKEEILRKKQFIYVIIYAIFKPFETILSDIFIIIVNIIMINTIKLDIVLMLIVIFTVAINYTINKKNMDLWMELLEKVKQNDKINNFYNFFLIRYEIQKELRTTKIADMLYQDATDNVDDIMDKMNAHNNQVFLLNIKQIFLVQVQNILIYVYIAFLYINQEISITEVGTLYLATNTIVVSLKNLFDAYISFDGIQNFAAIIAEIFDYEAKDNFFDEINTIEFKNVSYKYANQSEYSLKSISFKWDTNDKLAIVGINGSGKTTISKLIAGIYKPTEGQIYINGDPIDNQDISSKFGILHQKARLIESKLSDNFLNDADTAKLFEEFELNQFIDKLDKPVSTLFDEDGVNMSKGEIQKLLLSKMYQLNKELYIFDEPTSALDPLAEKQYLKVFEDKFNNIKSILIVHNMSLIKKYEQIIVLDGGIISGSGDFDQLLEENEIFRNLYQAHKTLYSDTK